MCECRVFVSTYKAEVSLIQFYCHPLTMKFDSSYQVIELLQCGGLDLYDLADVLELREHVD